MNNTSHSHYRFITMDLCIECNRVVTGRQHTLESNTDRLQMLWHEYTAGQRNAISLSQAASNIML